MRGRTSLDGQMDKLDVLKCLERWDRAVKSKVSRLVRVGTEMLDCLRRSISLIDRIEMFRFVKVGVEMLDGLVVV